MVKLLSYGKKMEMKILDAKFTFFMILRFRLPNTWILKLLLLQFKESTGFFFLLGQELRNLN